MLPFQIVKEPKLIFFQFKVIHNILPTQSNLFCAGIKDTDICPLCNSECQSLIHMLFSYMSASSTFWNQFRLWWQETFQEEITLPESVIRYGLTTPSSSLKSTFTFSLQVYAMAT